MKLYLIRHGESENNLAGLWTGWAQVSLTPKGEEDAKRIAPLLASVPFDRVYSSDLIRSEQTAAIALPNCTPTVLSLLREVNLGSLSGRPHNSLSEDQRKLIPTLGYTLFGGESHEDFYTRVRSFLSMMEESGFDNVAAFSHGGFLQAALDEVLGIKLPRGHVACNNCTVAIFEYLNGGWKLHSWINPL